MPFSMSAAMDGSRAQSFAGLSPSVCTGMHAARPGGSRVPAFDPDPEHSFGEIHGEYAAEHPIDDREHLNELDHDYAYPRTASMGMVRSGRLRGVTDSPGLACRKSR